MILNSKYTNQDILQFFLLYALAIITVYFLPNIVSTLYFWILLIVFWRSHKNAFWFILIFFLVDPPGKLFPEDWNYGLPIISALNIRFSELFAYVAFMKAIRINYNFKSVYLFNYKVLLVTLIIVLLYTLSLGTSLYSFLIVLKWLFIWSLLYSITKLIKTFDEWRFIFRICFILVFVAFGSQLLTLSLGYPPADLLGSNFSPLMDYGEGTKLTKVIVANKLIRPIGSSYIVLTGLIGSMFFLKYPKIYFSKKYMIIVMIIAYVSIFITATRGWFISFSVVFVLYFLFVLNLKKVASLAITLALVIPMLLMFPIIQKQFAGSSDRLSTLGAVAQGDLTAKGTNARVDYSWNLLNLWKEHPVFGWGFTDFYKANGNGHAGLANLIFNAGIIGFIAFIFFWFSLFSKPLIINKNISVTNPYKGVLIVFVLGFLVFFILNATSGQQFGFYLGFGAGVFGQIFFYAYSSFFILQALNEEKKIRLNKRNGRNT